MVRVGLALTLALTWSSLVPERRRHARWLRRPTRSVGRSPRLSRGALRCGVDSPCLGSGLGLGWGWG